MTLAKQIVDALEAAHVQAVIHRDLKPANIKVRPDGAVKVLDFGLAKALEPGGAARSDATASPTITSPALVTGVGVLLGTAAYMSPEQARGKPADRRSDIWALGCVLYEMLTGKRAFEDEDISLTLSNVLRVEPALDALPAGTPAAVRQALRLCLQKNPRERFQAIGDVRLALSNAFRAEPLPPTTPVAVRRGQVVALIAAALIGGALLSALTTRLRGPEPSLTVRTEIVTSGDAALNIDGSDRDLVITPDGSRIIYRGAGGLFVRALGDLEPRMLTNVETGSIFLSPDGQWVGFFGGGSINKVSVTGGPGVAISSVIQVDNAPRGATWGPQGDIVYATNAPATGLLRVSESGGTRPCLRPRIERAERTTTCGQNSSQGVALCSLQSCRTQTIYKPLRLPCSIYRQTRRRS